MKTLKQLEKEKKEIEKQIESLKQKDNVLFENKKLKIIKWENKKISELPKGTKIAKFQDFIDLIDSKEYELDKGIYYVRHFSKLQWNKEWCLSRVFLDSDGVFYSYVDLLAVSYDIGRVVIEK